MVDSEPAPPAVPTVDIAPYVRGAHEADRAPVARALDRACCEVGFVQVVGHGIPEPVISGLAGAMDRFFSLPMETKRSYVVPGANRGYSPPRSEALSLSIGVDSPYGTRDDFEAFNVGREAGSFGLPGLSEDDYGRNVWPDVAGFEPAVAAYYEHAARVAHTLTTVFEDALGLPPGLIHALTDHPIEVLRLNNYARRSAPGADGSPGRAMGEHTDFGIVTVLWADQVAGLQILGTDGSWHDVVPGDGALLVNVGDLTARLTNDRWLSTMHRVVPPSLHGAPARRRSAALFHDGNPEAVIAPVAGLGRGAAAAQYEPVVVREHLRAKLAGSRGGVRNDRVPRDAARLRSPGQEAGNQG